MSFSLQQPTLVEPLPPTVIPMVSREASLQERFEAFHQANPHVYEALKQLALNLKRRGMERCGIAGLFEVLRYRYTLQTSGDDYKLNNDYRSRYARLLMVQVPELRDFFETRCLSTE